MSEHKFPTNLADKSSAVCANGCGTIARQLKYTHGVGDVEYYTGIVRTGTHWYDAEGAWTTNAPPCEEES
jgi:hypothetical protein